MKSYSEGRPPMIGEKVILIQQGGTKEVGEVVAPPNGRVAHIGAWVYSPSRGYESDYALHNIYKMSDEIESLQDEIAYLRSMVGRAKMHISDLRDAGGEMYSRLAQEDCDSDLYHATTAWDIATASVDSMPVLSSKKECAQ